MFAKDWRKADRLFYSSEIGQGFEVDDRQFDPQTGDHNYISPEGDIVAVTQSGAVELRQLGEMEDDSYHSENCPGCGWGPGDGINPTCNHPQGCGHWREQ